MKNTLITTLGCLLAATLLAGCEKDDAPQSAAREAAVTRAPAVPQATETSEAADGYNVAARATYSESAWKALAGCRAALKDAEDRRASNTEVGGILEGKLCNPGR